MRSTPWERADLEAAAELVAAPGLEAYLLLALPLGELPATAVRRSPDQLTWRGHTVALPDPGTSELVGAVTALVVAGHRPEDRYLEPGGMPWEWVRPLRSGARQVVLGFETLLGGPAVTLHATLDPALAYELAELYALGELDGPPAPLNLADGEVLLDGDERCWRVDPAADPDRPAHHGQLLPTPARRLRRLAAELAASGIVELELLELDGDRYLLSGALADDPDWHIDVPVVCRGALTVVGVDPNTVTDTASPQQPPPTAWRWAGTHAGDQVGVRADGLWGYLRRTRSVTG